MLLQFSLSSLKTLCYIFTILVTFAGGILIYKASAFSRMWYSSQHNLGKLLVSQNDASLVFGICIVIFTIIGFFGLFWNKLKLLTIYQVCLTLVIPFLIIFGFVLYSDISSEHGRPMLRLRAMLTHLDPHELDDIQRSFQCCGIDKYTDYFMIWILWGVNNSEVLNNAMLAAKEKNAVPPVTGSGTRRIHSRLFQKPLVVRHLSNPEPYHRSNSSEQKLNKVQKKLRNVKFGQSLKELLDEDEWKGVMPKKLSFRPGDRRNYRAITSDINEELFQVTKALNKLNKKQSGRSKLQTWIDSDSQPANTPKSKKRSSNKPLIPGLHESEETITKAFEKLENPYWVELNKTYQGRDGWVKDLIPKTVKKWYSRFYI